MKSRNQQRITSGPAQRPGKVAAIVMASAVSVPVLIFLNLIEWLWF